MTKKIKKVEAKFGPKTNRALSIEPVANCDQLDEMDENGNHQVSGEIVLSQYEIEKLILTIRGKQVLIDRDYTAIVGVKRWYLGCLTSPSVDTQTDCFTCDEI